MSAPRNTLGTASMPLQDNTSSIGQGKLQFMSFRRCCEAAWVTLAGATIRL